ncbi:hypothetical protein P7H19_24690 [Paenibacillus larvae]|nr:hypothetical protein [Paenibacillus larvae]MDT2238833.1 hypothetical protein [Paenibacillus larvae]
MEKYPETTQYAHECAQKTKHDRRRAETRRSAGTRKTSSLSLLILAARVKRWEQSRFELWVNLDAVNFQKTIEQINREMKLVDASFKNASSSSEKFLEMRKISKTANNYRICLVYKSKRFPC